MFSILGSDGHCARTAALAGGVESPDEEKGENWCRRGDEHGCLVSTSPPYPTLPGPLVRIGSYAGGTRSGRSRRRAVADT